MDPATLSGLMVLLELIISSLIFLGLLGAIIYAVCWWNYLRYKPAVIKLVRINPPFKGNIQ